MDLSICIPTYNRAVDLRVLLDSILRQQPHGLAVEIAISDNASTDDTAGLIESYVESGISIVYDRLGKNIGFDGNILNAVRLSSGKY
ncbi:glycosyltransferase family 2 protein, partial [Klebsiella pneumoniae]